MVEHTQPIQIDAAILQEYVDALGSIGWQADGGIIRPVYSAAWVQARGQVAEWMRAAGLDVRGDTVGNLFGRLRGGDGSRTILTGSHLDQAVAVASSAFMRVASRRTSPSLLRRSVIVFLLTNQQQPVLLSR